MNDYKRIETIIRLLHCRHAEQPPLDELAKTVGLSRFHFHRLFSRWAGVTPKVFLKALTAQHARTLLLQSQDILTTTFETGLSSPGRLHDLIVTTCGVSPGELKQKGRGLTLKYGFQPTPFGHCLIATTVRGICHFAFISPLTRDQALNELKGLWPHATLRRDQSSTRSLISILFERHRRSQHSLVVDGTPFQLKVWEALLKIPEGHLVSYRQLSRLVGHPKAARAVGTAVASNPIAYLIPCHRVIRETGVIGDYRWGSERKKIILAYEASTT